MDRYLAHSPTDANPLGQPLKEHLENVADLAGEFSNAFGERDGRLCGLYHDIGKYSEAFQRRLAGSTERVDHSTAGALLMFEHKNGPAAMCIAGHHAGLADLGTKNDLADTFMARINHARREGLEDCSAWRSEIPETIPSGYENRSGIGNYFYTKMLFSALTDADWLDTEAYYLNRPSERTSCDLKELANQLDHYVKAWGPPTNAINRRRCRIRESAIKHAADQTGLFSMTVPTGGGKTLASMAFALHHAAEHGLKRIIYVIPYCSILEQTQTVFEGIFGKNVITAHYSGADFDRPESNADTRAFSTENWEAPIILTTAVQFFESLFSNKPGKNRKLHNIVQSVIVFDEAQMLPVPFLKPCLAGICQLVERYGCSAVLCTATQPAIEPILKKFLPNVHIQELCPEPENMYQAFRRVTYMDDGELSDEALVEQLVQRKQVLCVVNSRRQAQALYQALGTDEGNYHLSTMMIPFDRKRILREIRTRLRDGQPCRVISTSLIEAGVDVDFPEVYRALAGLDSIIQSGGRCNREGKRPCEDSLVHIFRTEAKAPRMLEQNISAAMRTLRRFEQADSPAAIWDYFQFLLYGLKDENQLDKEEIIPCAERLMFQTIADRFHLIDGAGYTVYIPIGEGAALAEKLRRGELSRGLMLQLGQYSVSVYRRYFEDLKRTGALEIISDNAGILCDLSLYSPDTGLPFDISEQNQAIFL